MTNTQTEKKRKRTTVRKIEIKLHFPYNAVLVNYCEHRTAADTIYNTPVHKNNTPVHKNNTPVHKNNVLMWLTVTLLSCCETPTCPKGG